MAALNVRLLIGLVAFPALVCSQASYVGSKACYGCHSAIYRSFTQTDMGRSMSLAGEWTPGTLPAEATLSQPGTSHSYSVSHTESGWIESESDAGVFKVEHALAYTVGSGANGLTFLIRRGDYLFEAPLSYYARPHKWDLSPGYEHVDVGFNRVVPEECINCHAGRSSAEPNRPGAYADPAFAELAIGCENCHGPGSAHVKSLGKVAGGIVNPAKLAPRLAENICMNCHQAGDTRVLQPGRTFQDFRPGQWLFDTSVILKVPAHSSEQRESDLLEHYSAMQASRCFRESNGKLGCLTCHDPHVQPRNGDVAGYYRAKCLTCHTEQSCSLPLKVRTSQNPPDDCAACHMPKRSVLQISHSALTNHRIPAREGEAVPPLSQPETDSLVIVNPPAGRDAKLSKMQLLRAYGELAANHADYEPRYFSLLNELAKTQPHDKTVEAALGHKALKEDRAEEAVSHLKLAVPPEGSITYLELGQALAKLGRIDESIENLKKGIEMDPYNAELQKTLILQYINLKSYGEARALMEGYVATFPEDSFMRGLLARVSR